MAQGDVYGGSNAKKTVRLLDSVTANNNNPATSEDGIPVYPTNRVLADDGICYLSTPARECSLFIKLTGTGAVSASFRLWGYLAALGEWVPLGTGASATKGYLNEGAPVDGTDKALHSEPVLYVGHFDRLYLEVINLTGTDAKVDAWIVNPRVVSY